MDDNELFQAGYNRVYDSLEPESNLDHVEKVMERVLNDWDAEETVCSWKGHKRIGEYLKKPWRGGGFRRSGYKKTFPFFFPAFRVPELGIALALQKIPRLRDKR